MELQNFELLYGADYNPEQWRNVPDILDKDIELMKRGGFNIMSVGIFSWGILEPTENQFDFSFMDLVIDKLTNANIKICLATPSAARPNRLGFKYPETLRTNEDRVRTLVGRRAEHCTTSPILRDKILRLNEALAKRYGDKIYLWHISNEYYGSCHCPLCQNAFREWLKIRYDNDLDKLNNAWWSDFWSGAYRAWEEIESPAPHGKFSSHALSLNWKRFATEQTISFMENELIPIRRITPNIPVTTNFHGNLSDINYWEVCKSLDIISWDMYPRWHTANDILTASSTAFVYDMCRSFLKKPFLLMESTPSCANLSEPNKLKKPGMNLLSSFQAIAHGSDSVQFFQWRKSRGGYEKLHGAVIDHSGRDDTRVFRECCTIGEMLKNTSEISGAKAKSDVAIIYDFENRWALDEAAGYCGKDKEYDTLCKSHYHYFWKNGINVDVIDETCDTLLKYRIIIAPMLYMLRNGIASKLRDFVQKGGILVSTFVSGIVNEDDLCYLGGFPGNELGKIFGIWAEETDSLCPNEEYAVEFNNKTYRALKYLELIHLTTAIAMSEYTTGEYAGLPAITCNQYGKGKAYYIGFNSSDDFFTQFYNTIYKNQNRSLRCTLPLGVTAHTRYKNNTEYIFVENYSDATVQINLDKPYYSLSDKIILNTLHLKPLEISILKNNF